MKRHRFIFIHPSIISSEHTTECPQYNVPLKYILSSIKCIILLLRVIIIENKKGNFKVCHPLDTPTDILIRQRIDTFLS